MQAGTACFATIDLFGAWKCRGTACRARRSRSSMWLLKYVAELMMQATYAALQTASRIEHTLAVGSDKLS